MSNLLEIAQQQVTRDVVLHAASNNLVQKDGKVLLTHNLGVSREPEDAHRELGTLGYTVVRTSTASHQNIARPGSTRQMSVRNKQSWNYRHPEGFKAEMHMNDGGGTSVVMNAPQRHHERFRQRMDLKPHPAFKKMAEEQAAKKDTKQPTAKIRASADLEVALLRNPLYAAGKMCACMGEYGKMKAAIKAGTYKAAEMTEDMDAKTAPGWEGTVKHMKTDHPDIDNPWALTNWMHDQGYKSHFKKSGKAKKVEAREFSDKRRDNLADKKKALPDGSFPIVNQEDLANAKRAVGRAKNPGRARAWINKRAKQMGQPKIGE